MYSGCDSTKLFFELSWLVITRKGRFCGVAVFAQSTIISEAYLSADKKKTHTLATRRAGIWAIPDSSELGLTMVWGSILEFGKSRSMKDYIDAATVSQCVFVLSHGYAEECRSFLGERIDRH